MPKKNRISIPPHRLGHQANKQARAAHFVRNYVLPQVQGRFEKFRHSIDDVAQYSVGFKILCLLMGLCWMAVITWEFLISQEFYRDFVGGTQGILQFFPLVALFLVAMLFSAMLAEPFHPLFAELYEEESSYPYAREAGLIAAWQIPWKWIIFAAGVLMSGLATYFVYSLSSERVQLMTMAGEEFGNYTYQVLLPAVLFVCEIATGIFVIYCLQIVYYFLGARIHERRIPNLLRDIDTLEYEAFHIWEAYHREMQHHHSLHDSPEQAVVVVPELRAIINRIYNLDDQTAAESENFGNVGGGAENSSANPSGSDVDAGTSGNHNHHDQEIDLRRLLDEQNRRNNNEL